MVVSPWYRFSPLHGKKLSFILILAVMVFLAISTYQYSAFLELRLSTKQAKNEDVNGNMMITETGQGMNSIIAMNGTPPIVFAHRLERVQEVCASHPHLQGNVHGIFTHPSGVIYCFVPKAGCTFWKRIFNFAAQKNNTKYKNPWNMPRLLVHTNNLRNGLHYDRMKHSSTNFPMRFIVSRDPFSRLASSYLDKFYLPDFWYRFGKVFSKNDLGLSKTRTPDFLTHHFDSLQSMFDKNRTLEQRIRCGKRVTFAEFVVSLLKKPESHWMPIHKLCNPCDFKPTHIVHIDSFMSDSKVILRKMGLDKLVEGFTHNEQVHEEIQTIVDYNFRRVLIEGPNAKELSACINKQELAFRLWHNFRWRGYIHPDVNYTIPDSNACVQTDLLKQLWRARLKGLEDKEAMKRVAKKFKFDLYATIDQQLYEGLKKTFEMDFQFFGYDDFFKNITYSQS